MSNNIAYHTRLYGDQSKVCAEGVFGGCVDMTTAQRLVNAHFTVAVRKSGTPVFVDKQGREVSLYFTIAARDTPQGQVALKRFRDAQESAQKAQEIQDDVDDAEIEHLIKSLSILLLKRRH